MSPFSLSKELFATLASEKVAARTVTREIAEVIGALLSPILEGVAFMVLPVLKVIVVLFVGVLAVISACGFAYFVVAMPYAMAKAAVDAAAEKDAHAWPPARRYWRIARDGTAGVAAVLLLLAGALWVLWHGARFVWGIFRALVGLFVDIGT